MATRDPAEFERRIRNLTEKLLATFEELDFVHSLAGVLANPGSVADLDSYLLRETASIFGADGGWVARRRASGDFETTAVSGLKSNIPRFLMEKLVEPLARDGALPYLVDDLTRSLVPLGLTGPPGIPRAFLVAPLTVNAEVLGVIALGKSDAGDIFTAGDQKLLSTLAVQAALFIRNADLVQALKAEAKTLGRRVEQLESDPRHRPDLTWIEGASPTMSRLARQVEGAAVTDATVLLLGESGTGKSLVARVLHRHSERRSGPFVELNCGAMPPTLIESELFGHARGAFTGADRERAGLFEEAHGGTILLDEVAELPPESQVKLLTVLERHRVRRVGENRDRAIDVRVVAATNADLPAAVRAGKFREDLFYRLNVISFTLPPLRQRREDILPLALRFLDEVARETNRRVSGFSPAAEKALLAYSWPGNIRELRNAVERSLLLKASGSRVDRDDLPALGSNDPKAEEGALSGGPLPDQVRDFEKRLILEALKRNEGVVTRAASALGLSRTNLHNKLKKHDLLKAQNWS